MDPIRVLCVDDSPDVAEMFQRLIDLEPDMCCVGITTQVERAAESARALGATCALFDLTMPAGPSPLGVIEELTRSMPDLRILAISGFDDESTRMAAMDAGAWGFVSKGNDPETILEALRSVARGEVLGDDWTRSRR